MVGQIERFLDRGIAAADDDNLLAAKEKPVAGGAGRHAKAAKDVLARQTEPARLGAGGEDQGVADIDVARIAARHKRPPREIDRLNQVDDNPGPDMLGLLLHLLHQPRALDHLGEARVILDIGRDRQLASGLQPGDQQRFEIGARRINRCSVARRAGADDQDLAVVAFGHRGFQSLRRLLLLFHRTATLAHQHRLNPEHMVEAEGAAGSEQPVIAEQPAGGIADDRIGFGPGAGAGRGVEQRVVTPQPRA